MTIPLAILITMLATIFGVCWAVKRNEDRKFRRQSDDAERSYWEGA